jgi:hypothetical protein
VVVGLDGDGNVEVLETETRYSHGHAYVDGSHRARPYPDPSSKNTASTPPRRGTAPCRR